MQLDAKIPSGPIQDKWDTHRQDMKLVKQENGSYHTETWQARVDGETSIYRIRVVSAG